jgi:hypothetical protein
VHVPSHDTLPSSSSLDSPVDSKAGWLLKRDKKKFMVMSSERVFCLLKEGVLFYFTKQKTNPKNFETGLLFPEPWSPLLILCSDPDPDFIGQTDLAGTTCKMTIEATHRFGIEIACQNGSGQVIQLNAESHADQKHWSFPHPPPSLLTLSNPPCSEGMMLSWSTLRLQTTPCYELRAWRTMG